MKKGTSFLLILFIALIFTGCNHYYNRFVITGDLYSQLKVKETKSEEVIKLIGEPYQVSFVGNGYEIWTYISGYDKTRTDPDFKSYETTYVKLYYLVMDENTLIKVRSTRYRPLGIFLRELEYDDKDNDFLGFRINQSENHHMNAHRRAMEQSNNDAMREHLRIHEMHMNLHNSTLK